LFWTFAGRNRRVLELYSLATMPTFYGLRITHIVPARHKSQPRAPQALLVTVVYLPQIVVLKDGNNRNMHSAGFEVPSCLHSALTCTSLRCMLAKFDLFSSPTSFVCWKAFGNVIYCNIVLVNVCYVSLHLPSILMMFLHSAMLAVGVSPSLS